MMVLTIETLNLDNLLIWEGYILDSQHLFHPNLRITKDEISEMLDKSISKIATIDSKYAGYCLACKLIPSELPSYFSAIDSEKVLDLYHVAVDSIYQRKGVAESLIKEVITSGKQEEFRQIIGWYNQYSLPLIKKLGAVEISKEPNWYKTGEDYICCVLNI